MNERNLKMTEMQKRQSQNKKPWRHQNQLIRPPTFLPPHVPPTNHFSSCTPPRSSFDNQVSFDFRTSFLRNSPSPLQASSHGSSDTRPSNFPPPFGHSNSNSSFSSHITPKPCQQSFPNTINKETFASAPSPWITPPLSNPVNIPNQSSFHPSNDFSSPFPLQQNRLSTSAFGPPPNAPPPQIIFSSSSNFSPSTHSANSFLPFSSNSITSHPPPIFSSPPPPATPLNNNPFCSFNPLSPPPQRHPSAAFSSPPPTALFNNEINSSHPFPSQYSLGNSPLPNHTSGSNIQIESVAFRPPPPFSGSRPPHFVGQGLQTFHNNLHRPSNPTPPNCRF